MFNHSWKKELLTIPNLLSMLRLLLIPVYIHMYTNAETRLDYYLAGSILGFSCLTDFADGIIAREYNMITNVGKLLDPLADKLTQFSLILCLSKAYPVLYPLLALFLIKEIFQCSIMLVFAQNGKCLKGALLSGKISTTVLFISLILLVIFPDIPYQSVCMLVAADSLFLLTAFWRYSCAYLGKKAKLTDLPNE